MRSANLAALMAALAACGRLDFDPHAGRDALATDSTPSMPDAACTLGPWGSPVALASLNTTNTDYGGQLTADGLAIYFDSDRTGQQDLYVARRDTRAATFGAPTRIAELSSQQTDADPSPTADELDLIFDSNRTNDLCLWESTRASIADAWGAPVKLAALCAPSAATGPYLTGDGLTLYFTIGVDPQNEGALGVTHRPSRTDPFGPVTPLPEQLTTNPPDGGYPALTADQRTIYFEQANGSGGAATITIHEATRDASGGKFGTRQPFDAVTLGPNNGDPSITADGLDFAFDSDASGNADLYEMTRSCE